MPRASSWSYPKEHKLGFHGDDSPRWALVGPLVSENRVLRLVRPGLAGTQDGRPRQLPGSGDWPSQGGKPSRSHRLSGEGAKGLRSERGVPLVRVHGGQGREVVDTRRRGVLHSTSKDLVAEQIQQVQDGRANDFLL